MFGVTAILTGALIAYRFSGRRFTLPFVVALFVVTVVIDGAPSFGSDVGGVLALVPSLGLTAILLTGRKPRLRTVVIAAVAAVVALALFLVIDLRQPVDSQTHLARLYEDTQDRGFGALGDTLERKATSNLRVFTSTIWTFFVPPALLAMIYLLRRPSGRWQQFAVDYPKLRAGLIGGLLLAVLGFAVNDSGIVIPAVILSFLVPMALIVHLSMEAPPCGGARARQEGGSGMTRDVALMAAVSGLTRIRRCRCSPFEWRSPRLLDPSCRTNVNEREVPVVLGFGIVFGTIAGAFALMFSDLGDRRSIDRARGGDRGHRRGGCDVRRRPLRRPRGDEKARGFRGHLSSASGGALTGGVVKIVGGWHRRAIATMPVDGLGTSSRCSCSLRSPPTSSTCSTGPRAERSRSASYSLFHSWCSDPPDSRSAWRDRGASSAVTPVDVRERAMLGDAGANPIGAIVGLALAYLPRRPFRVARVGR